MILFLIVRKLVTMTKQQAVNYILDDAYLLSRICNHERCKDFETVKQTVLEANYQALEKLK